MGIGIGGGDWYDGNDSLRKLGEYKSKVVILKASDLNQDSSGFFRLIEFRDRGRVKKALYPVLCEGVTVYVGYSKIENRVLIYQNGGRDV